VLKKVLIPIGLVVIVAIFIVVNLQRREKATDVRTEPVSRLDLIELASASGKVQPKISVDISADVTGKIVAVHAEEGDVVKNGQLLLEIDPTQFRETVRSQEAQYQSSLAALREAEARLEQQASEWERAQGLFAGQGISTRDYESARTSYKLAEAQLVSAQRRVDQSAALLEQGRDNLAKTSIRAPMDGVVVRREADVGEIAIQSSLSIQVLMVIADLSVMEVEVDVDETEIPRVDIGQAASVEIDAYPDSTFHGRVTEIANSPRQASTDRGVDFKVVITLDRGYTGLRPGLSATAEITTARRDSALAIPIQALTMRTTKTLESEQSRLRRRLGDAAPADFVFTEDQKEVEGVLVVADDRALFVPVATGITGEKHFEVLSGLTGDEIIVTGPMRTVRTLTHGERVKIERGNQEEEAEANAERSSGVSVEVD
jgi:HlyD family secretion protein